VLLGTLRIYVLLHECRKSYLYTVLFVICRLMLKTIPEAEMMIFPVTRRSSLRINCLFLVLLKNSHSNLWYHNQFVFT
jgi:hypothetical protein